MDPGETPRRRGAAKSGGAEQELATLRERVLRLESHLAGLESALEAMGWRKLDQPSAAHVQPAVSPAYPAASPPQAAASPPQAEASPVFRRTTPSPPPAPFRPAATWEPEAPGPARLATGEVEREFDVVGWLTRLGPAKILALVGGGAMLLGMAYFLSLAFSRGWITPEMRVVLGLLLGFALLPAGALLFDRARPTLGHVVVAVGLGTIDLALFASRLYELAPAEVALLGALIAAVGAGVIAVRWNSQLVAGMGIAAVLGAPPIVGAPPNLVTVGFLGAVLVGVAYVSFRRDWEWLPWLSFGLTAPQLLVWLRGAGVEPALVIAVLGAYWILFSVSAVVPVIYGQPRPLPTPVLLLGAIAAFATLAAYEGLADHYLRGAFVAALALGNLAAGVGLARRRGLTDDLAQAALGLAIALYVVAFALALEGPAVTIAWTVGMVAAAFAWARFGLARAGAAAVVLGVMTAAHLLLIDFNPLIDWIAVWFGGATSPEKLIPYANPEGIALAVFLAGLAVAAWLTKRPELQQAIAAGGLMVVAATVPLEAFDLADQYGPPMVLLGWTALATLALAADRAWNRTWRFTSTEQLLPPAGAIIGALAALYLAVQYRLIDLLAGPRPVNTTPFTDEQSVMTFVVVIALWFLAATRTLSSERIAVICLSFLVLAGLLRQQLPAEWVVVGWSALAVGALVGASLERPGSTFGQVIATMLLIGAGLITLFGVAPISRLGVQLDAGGVGSGPPNAATIAMAALGVALAVATWREERMVGTRWLGIGVLIAVVYGLSVGLVDSFAVRVPSLAALEEISTQAQVALTILWAVIGLGLLGYGLLRDSLAGRGAGLALLGLATAKTFIYDLASLDIAYRVLSLLGVGVLLLAGAYAYQRLRARSVIERPMERTAD